MTQPYNSYRIVWLVFLCFLSKNITAQDPHFTQATLAPTFVNPALSGAFEHPFSHKDLRVSTNYRDQWRTIESDFTSYKTPFVTATFGIDGQIKTRKFTKGDYGGWGLNLIYDNSGDLKLTTTGIQLSLAYHKSIGKEGKTYLSAGASYAYLIKSIDYSQGYFDEQWTGIEFNPDLSTGENFSSAQFNYSDVNIGFLFRHRFYNDVDLSIGYSFHHANRPDQLFGFSTSEGKLNPNNILHSQIVLPFTEVHHVVLEEFYQTQAATNELKAGAYYRLLIEQDYHKDQYIQIGPGLREVANISNGLKTDAFYLAARYRYDDFIFGFAYDFNVSGLVAATNTHGAFEISITYYEDLYRQIKRPRKRHGDYAPKCP